MNYAEREQYREAKIDQILAGLAAILSGEATLIVDRDGDRTTYAVQTNAG